MQQGLTASVPPYEKAAERDHADAQFRCGAMYDKGEGTAVDKDMALYWYEKAAEQGHQDAKDALRENFS